MSGPTTITINASSWARVTRERDEARQQNEEQARLLAMSADREEKLRTELEEIQKRCERLHWAWQVAAGKNDND